MIAPRFIAELTPLRSDSPTAPPPIGPAVWEETQVAVENMPSSPLRNVFTGQVLTLENACLPVATALADFPIALMAIAP